MSFFFQSSEDCKMREDRPSLGGQSFCYANVPQRRVHWGEKKADFKLCFQLFLAQQKITKKCSLLNIQTFCLHSWKLNYVSSHLGFIWAFKENANGRYRLCTGWANWTWQRNPSARQSAGASFVAGFSIGLKDTLIPSLYPHFWHAFISRACQHPQKARNICECTPQRCQVDLKRLIGTTMRAACRG